MTTRRQMVSAPVSAAATLSGTVRTTAAAATQLALLHMAARPCRGAVQCLRKLCTSRQLAELVARELRRAVPMVPVHATSAAGTATPATRATRAPASGPLLHLAA